MDSLGNERHRIFEECGFEYLEEFCHGVAIWKYHEVDTLLYLMAKPYGSFTHFEVVLAESKDEAVEFAEDHAISFEVISEEQIKTVLNSML